MATAGVWLSPRVSAGGCSLFNLPEEFQGTATSLSNSEMQKPKAFCHRVLLVQPRGHQPSRDRLCPGAKARRSAPGAPSRGMAGACAQHHTRGSRAWPEVMGAQILLRVQSSRPCRAGCIARTKPRHQRGRGPCARCSPRPRTGQSPHGTAKRPVQCHCWRAQPLSLSHQEARLASIRESIKFLASINPDH